MYNDIYIPGSSQNQPPVQAPYGIGIDKSLNEEQGKAHRKQQEGQFNAPDRIDKEMMHGKLHERPTDLNEV